MGTGTVSDSFVCFYGTFPPTVLSPPALEREDRPSLMHVDGPCLVAIRGRRPALFRGEMGEEWMECRKGRWGKGLRGKDGEKLLFGCGL